MSWRSNVRRSNVGAQMWALKGRVTDDAMAAELDSVCCLKKS
jgi:hypothetical protein